MHSEESWSLATSKTWTEHHLALKNHLRQCSHHSNSNSVGFKDDSLPAKPFESMWALGDSENPLIHPVLDASALFEPVFRSVDDEAFLIPCLIPLVWRGFPLFYHDCFMSAGRTMMHHCQCTMPGLARNATEGASSSSMVRFPAGRVLE
ncbi:hypothetical protein Nepgr_003861 [Nepenthes gracilis]|uniref:Uncharacterized protein n=1 Tax=Nepenthes gracilis TaxID=150966 RepID=A0AAD3XEC6_NEPGR|nr:hypothetical protein Nepgr_003861 [Nepenthes gracilis]